LVAWFLGCSLLSFLATRAGSWELTGEGVVIPTAAEAAKLATYNKKSTISSREVQTGELSLCSGRRLLIAELGADRLDSTNSRSSPPPWRTLQACHLGGNQGCHQGLSASLSSLSPAGSAPKLTLSSSSSPLLAMTVLLGSLSGCRSEMIVVRKSCLCFCASVSHVSFVASPSSRRRRRLVFCSPVAWLKGSYIS